MKKIKYGAVADGTAVADFSRQKPKYGDFRYVEQHYGVTKGVLYPLFQDGRVKSIVIQNAGTSRGKRLINLESLEAYLESLELAAGA